MNDKRKFLYERWVAAAFEHNVQLANYACPKCLRTLYINVPDKGDVYDTAAICPYCDHIHYKIVHADGSVHLSIGNQA